VTLKSIPDLTDVPVYWLSMTMLKHFRDFETCLSQGYGVEGFPLDYVVRPPLAATDWGLFVLRELCHPGQGELMPDFFQFEESDYHCRQMAPIVDPMYENTVHGANESLLAAYKSGKYADRRSDSFHCDDAIVFALARIAFKDSPGECHFVPRKGKHLQSRWEAYIACKGQFVGINTAWQETDMAWEIMSKMQFEDESHNWDWNRHCAKFHQQLVIIDEWAIAGLAMRMSNKDQISTFLKTILKDCKNGNLLITKGIIEGD